jgi:SAM-dependent methyltransferase
MRTNPLTLATVPPEEGETFLRGRTIAGRQIMPIFPPELLSEADRAAVADMVPPPSMDFVGAGWFLEMGREFLDYFINLGGLQPDARVLEVGCGIGRMAVPLTQYLDDSGSYDGFDIVPAGIDWCRERITTRRANFRFQLVDIYNSYYHPTGHILARDFVFPYEAATFDFVFLTSVFTHMDPPEVVQYVREIARVLKPGGRCFSTFFLLNRQSLRLMRQKKSKVRFHFRFGRSRIMNRAAPNEAVAYREPFVRKLFRKHDLEIVGPIHYGYWCERPSFLSFQDVILTQKGAA